MIRNEVDGMNIDAIKWNDHGKLWYDLQNIKGMSQLMS